MSFSMLLVFVFIITPVILVLSIFVEELHGVAFLILKIWIIATLFVAFYTVSPEMFVNGIVNVFLFIIYIAVAMVYMCINFVLLVSGRELIPFHELTDLMFFYPVFS